MSQIQIEWADKHFIRFMSRVYKTPSCWEWMGAIARRYGLFRVGKRNIKAHRLSWLFFRGTIPQGLCVLHRCDNPKCVNPDHLFLGTIGQNNQDMIAKGRQARPAGELNPMAKLTSREVMRIKIEYIPGKITQQQIANRYGVSRQTITAIIQNQNWRNCNAAYQNRVV